MQSTFSISLNLSQKHTTELIIITRTTFFILIIRIKIERAVVRIVVTTCWIRLGRLRCVFKLTHNRVKLHSLSLQRVWIRIRLRFYFNTFNCILQLLQRLRRWSFQINCWIFRLFWCLSFYHFLRQYRCSLKNWLLSKLKALSMNYIIIRDSLIFCFFIVTFIRGRLDITTFNQGLFDTLSVTFYEKC